MTARRGLIGGALATMIVLGAQLEARAQFGGLQRFIFDQVSQALSPSSLSSPQNGPLTNFNIFDQRVELNRLGNGFSYEFFRFFGPDTFGNPNTVDLGPIKLELGLDPNVIAGQPVGIHNKVGFTTTLIPELTFETQTGQRVFNQFSGISNFSEAPLQYRATVNTGVQDFELVGNLLVDANARVNMMGFYDLELRVINVGESHLEGVAVEDHQVTDFDTGPINISGNLIADAVSALLTSDGNQLAATGTRVASGAAQKERADDLMAKLESGESLSDDEIQFLVEQMFKTAFEADPIGVLFNGLPSEIPGFEALSLEYNEAPSDPTANPSPIPEPGTLLLLGVAAVMLLSVRPRLASRTHR